MLHLKLLFPMLIMIMNTICKFQGIPYLSRLIKSQESRVIHCLLYNVTIKNDNLYEALAVFNYNLEQLVPMMEDKQPEIVHIVRNLNKQQGPAFIHGMPFDEERIRKNFNYTDVNITVIRRMLKKTNVLWGRVRESYSEHKSWLDEMYDQWFRRL